MRQASRAVAVLALALTACQKAAAPPAQAGADSTAAAAATDTAPARAITPIPFVMRTNPNRFAHYAHRGVSCSTCHPAVPGHGRHGALACSECHEQIGATATAAPVTSVECNACHHAADQARPCLECHGSAPAGPLAVRTAVRVSVRPATEERSLTFDHARHQSLACGECHADKPHVGAPRPCSACHDRHHRPDAQCSSCHQAALLPMHDRSAHRGCGGSGCHQDPVVASLPLTRPVCLVCHRDRQDHEPGENCARCHLLSTGDGPRSIPAAPRGEGR